MSLKPGLCIDGRPFDKPGLLGFSEKAVFYFTSGIVPVINFHRGIYRTICKNDHGFGIRIIIFIPIM